MESLRISNARRKFLQGLKLKKNRLKYSSFVVEGPKVVKEILLDKILTISEVYATSSWNLEDLGASKSDLPTVLRISSNELGRISNFKNPNEVLAVVKIPAERVRLESQRIVYLDGLRDPGNLGTIIRTCDWFGVEQVIQSPGSVDLYNPKVVQAAMGSVGRVAHCVMPWSEVRNRWPDLTCYHATSSGDTDWKTTEDKGWILTIGSESHGLHNEILDSDGLHIAIAKGEHSRVDSLNASLATAILLAALCSSG